MPVVTGVTVPPFEQNFVLFSRKAGPGVNGPYDKVADGCWVMVTLVVAVAVAQPPDAGIV